MRAAFCGKGGSGKTSLASLFIHFIVGKGYQTLAIDGDINQHLGENLFFTAQELNSLPRLGENMSVLKEYVRGTNPYIRRANEIAESTPAGNGSCFITVNDESPINKEFVLKKNNLSFIAMGGHNEHDVGATCYHKFTGVLGVLLNHLLDNDDEIIVADMCAGADPFASSGLASRFDAIFLACEATKKSLSVFDQAVKYSEYHNLKLYVVGNKIDTDEDEEFIKNYVGEYYLTGFKTQAIFKKFERGQIYKLSDVDDLTITSLELILHGLVQQTPRDWVKYQETGLFFHKRAAESWANKSYGLDLQTQIDPNFSYDSVIKELEGNT